MTRLYLFSFLLIISVFTRTLDSLLAFHCKNSGMSPIGHLLQDQNRGFAFSNMLSEHLGDHVMIEQVICRVKRLHWRCIFEKLSLDLDELSYKVSSVRLLRGSSGQMIAVYLFITQLSIFVVTNRFLKCAFPRWRCIDTWMHCHLVFWPSSRASWTPAQYHCWFD